MVATRNILVVYCNNEHPPRRAVHDHLYSFARYGDARCFYFNAAFRPIPAWLLAVRYDLILFHTVFLSCRWHRPTFEKAVDRVRPLRDLDVTKAVLPQDEFINMDMVCDFIRDFGVGHVFSVAPPSEWETIYPNVDRHRTSFHHVLTGYLDEMTLARIGELARRAPSRPVGIGYRAWRAEPWLGRHGFLKTAVADAFLQHAAARGVVVDISTRREDTFLGDDWLHFLLRCRYTIGVEGGASLLDWDGTIRARTQAYLEFHPNADFEEVEAACFPGRDGSLRLYALSPRQLEAAATRTGQILVEGEYNGVLVPRVHYIPIRRDLGDVEAAFNEAEDENRRLEMVEAAYRDVVSSGKYNYRIFVGKVLGAAIPSSPLTSRAPGTDRREQEAWRRSLRLDRASWRKARWLTWWEAHRRGLFDLLRKVPPVNRYAARRRRG